MLEGLAPKEKETICFLMNKATRELDDKDLNVLLEALKDPRWSESALADALSARGFKVSRGVIHRHKAGVCGCAR